MRKKKKSETSTQTKNILPELDIDQHLSDALKDSKKCVTLDRNLRFYIRRPLFMENLSASEFYESYHISKLGNRKKFHQNFLLLPPTYLDKGSPKSKCDYLVYALNTSGPVPKNRRFLNVIDKGKIDEFSPRFAAAALALHVPFRSISSLMGNQNFTTRLRSLLSKVTHPLLNWYTAYCMELSNEFLSITNK